MTRISQLISIVLLDTLVARDRLAVSCAFSLQELRATGAMIFDHHGGRSIGNASHFDFYCETHVMLQ